MFDLYKKTTIGDATTYVRPFQTVSNGPLVGLNSLTIFEEKVIVLPDASSVVVPLDTVVMATITDPTESFNVVNPATGAVIGTKTLAELKIEMYSLYLHLAAQRDEAE